MDNRPPQSPPANQSPPKDERYITIPTYAKRPYLTYVLIGVIVAIFFAQGLLSQVNYPDQEPITPWGALDFVKVLRGEHYRLFTAMFLHINQIHLFFNAASLWFVGRVVERLFGTPRFALIYFLGGISGSIASFIFTRGIAAGASGAIFAIFGAEMVFLYHNRALLGKMAQEQFRSLALLAVLNLGLGLLTEVIPGAVQIDNWGHIGGFFGGVVLTWFLAPQYALQEDNTAPRGLKIVDIGILQRTWYVPLVYFIGMVGVYLYAFSNFR